MCCKRIREKSYVRIGGNRGDGGYIMVDDFNDKMRVYSVGIGDNVSYDSELANKGIKVFMYDHTIYRLSQVHNNFIFHRLGVGTGDNCLPLEDILRENDDLDNHNLILKMDIVCVFEEKQEKEIPYGIRKYKIRMKYRIHYYKSEE